MRSVTLVGAGFSGLTLAFELQRLGLKVQVIEKQKRTGGLLGTRCLPEGLVETAANALLANKEIEDLFAELQIPFAHQLPTRKRRYIFWNHASRWPLSKRSTVLLAWTLARGLLGRTEVLPRVGETVHDWTTRVLNEEIEQRLIQPGLQGVFASTTKMLSAQLTLANMLQKKAQRGNWKGSVAPQGGMEQLITKLSERITSHGGEIIYDHDFKLPENLKEPVVLATSVANASEIVRVKDPQLAEALATCEMLPLMSVTAFFNPGRKDLEGFGCLFPPEQNFSAMGVLFNTSIFSNRGNRRSETWIFGGQGRAEFLNWSEDQIRQAIVKDRERLNGDHSDPLRLEVTRWPWAIPHYSVAWEKTLKTLNPKPPLFLHGNYLGSLGLSRIYSRSRQMAKTIQELYG